MNKKVKIWLYAIVFIGISLNLGMYVAVKIAQYEAKNLFKSISNHDKVFVYETYYGALNAVMYVEDLEDTSSLIAYYDKTSVRDSTAVINFKIKTMPITSYEPIYVSRYFNKGSKIVELVNFNTRCWGYIKGYVYKSATHTSRPPDSLVRQADSAISRYNSDKHVQMMNKITKGISDYGWYCHD